MRKFFLLLIAASLLLIGCGEMGSGESLVTYDNSQLAGDLENEGIEPKLPTEFPVDIAEYEIVKPPHESSRHEIQLTGKNGEIFNLVVHTSPVTYDGELENQEEVKINGNEGFYAENDVTGPSVHWTDEGFHYILEYQSIGLDTEVNKETMMAIAESYK
ncbi:DUF4367 domain-containing protein [Rossellomorea vietnamensis]|uniref:DUF4367 domain-containing protein n=1 Tax=Rossellomorea vietnamensis TaxID=218284 RepID=A0A0P6WTB4_9BACI|nr:DUF4367 domain-containing protein [Rossellomorea vietnamensis]KPL60993.1 hypothetical protein AM506_04515 [Rossellomorea vietnamensis]